MQETPEENLALLWDFIQHAYDYFESKNRVSQIKMSMFNTKSQPKMRGKAAEIKDLNPVILAVCQQYLNKKLVLHQKIIYVMEGIVCIYFKT